jgi:hypothetical protein
MSEPLIYSKRSVAEPARKTGSSPSSNLPAPIGAATTTRQHTVADCDVILVGAGIMSATRHRPRSELRAQLHASP